MSGTGATAVIRETWSVPSSNVMDVGGRHSLDLPRNRHFVPSLKNVVKDQPWVFPALEARRVNQPWSGV